MMSITDISGFIKMGAEVGEYTVNSSHDESYLHGISCACKVSVNLFRFVLVQ